MTEDDMTGTWLCTHWYPSKDDSDKDVSKHYMRAYRKGDELVLESIPERDESYMFVRLRIDGDVAAGSWHESTKIEGDFKGAQYSGAGELIIGEDRQSMEGLWAGAGLDHKLGKLRIYTDKWRFERPTKDMPA